MNRVEWIGKRLATSSFIGPKYYSKFCYKNIEAEVGDFILVPSNACSPRNDVAKILELFEDDIYASEPCRMKVKRFLWPERLAENYSTDDCSEPLPDFHECLEVIEDARDRTSDLAVERVHGKCAVIMSASTEDVDLTVENNADGTTPTYVCRHRLKSSAGRLTLHPFPPSTHRPEGRQRHLRVVDIVAQMDVDSDVDSDNGIIIDSSKRLTAGGKGVDVVDTPSDSNEGEIVPKYRGYSKKSSGRKIVPKQPRRSRLLEKENVSSEDESPLPRVIANRKRKSRSLKETEIIVISSHDAEVRKPRERKERRSVHSAVVRNKSVSVTHSAVASLNKSVPVTHSGKESNRLSVPAVHSAVASKKSVPVTRSGEESNRLPELRVNVSRLSMAEVRLNSVSPEWNVRATSGDVSPNAVAKKMKLGSQEEEEEWQIVRQSPRSARKDVDNAKRIVFSDGDFETLETLTLRRNSSPRKPPTRHASPEGEKKEESTGRKLRTSAGTKTKDDGTDVRNEKSVRPRRTLRDRSSLKKPAVVDDDSSDSTLHSKMDADRAARTPVRRSTKKDCATPKSSVRKSILVTTPSSVKKTPKSVRVSLLTPSMPQRGSAASTPGTPLEEARARLHVSAVPTTMPCREAEFSSIYNFLAGKLEDRAGGCMYISGVPGTGKTATVRQVVETLQKDVKKGGFPEFNYVEINGMKMTEPRQAYVQILAALTNEKLTADQALRTLEKRFTQTKQKKTTLLVVDELDLICNKRQDVVYNLLDWPSKAGSLLVVVTIANTMDLPETMLKGRVTSRLGLTRLTFKPYNFRQLQEIVAARLSGLEAFDVDAVQLVARKVASISGDARRALDICRRATEIAESEDNARTGTPKKGNARTGTPKKGPRKAGESVLVLIKHVETVMDEMTSSSTIRAISVKTRGEESDRTNSEPRRSSVRVKRPIADDISVNVIPKKRSTHASVHADVEVRVVRLEENPEVASKQCGSGDAHTAYSVGDSRVAENAKESVEGTSKQRRSSKRFKTGSLPTSVVVAEKMEETTGVVLKERRHSDMHTTCLVVEARDVIVAENVEEITRESSKQRRSNKRFKTSSNIEADGSQVAENIKEPTAVPLKRRRASNRHKTSSDVEARGLIIEENIEATTEMTLHQQRRSVRTRVKAEVVAQRVKSSVTAVKREDTLHFATLSGEKLKVESGDGPETPSDNRRSLRLRLPKTEVATEDDTHRKGRTLIQRRRTVHSTTTVVTQETNKGRSARKHWPKRRKPKRKSVQGNPYEGCGVVAENILKSDDHAILSSVKRQSAKMLAAASDLVRFYQRSVTLDREAAARLCVATAEQAGPAWKEARKLRITASRCYSFYTHSQAKCQDWEYKLHDVLYPRHFFNFAMKNGVDNEENARVAYARERGVNVARVGLIVNPSAPWLGCSPDGVVTEDGTPTRLLEIKCPMKGMEKTAQQVVANTAYYCPVRRGLKKRHPYYGQVQLGMAVTGLKVCDFVIYSSYDDTVAVEEIPYDEEFATDMITAVTRVYFQHMLPYLVDHLGDNDSEDSKENIDLNATV